MDDIGEIGERDELYRSFFEQSPDAQVVVDANGVIERLNRRAEELFGYAEGELVGSEVEVLVPERLRAIHRAHRSGLFEAPAVGRLRPLVHGRRRDGSEMAIGVNLNSVEYVSGRRTLATIRDIDGWADAFNTQAAFDEAPIAMALVEVAADGDRIIRSANRALAELLGQRGEELVGQSLRELTHDEDRAVSDVAAAEVLDGTTEFGGRKRYRRHDGRHVWVDVYARIISSSGAVRLALVHVLDVEDRVTIEERQRELAERLEDEVAERTMAHAESERRLRLSLTVERDLLLESQEQQQRLDMSLRAAGMGTCEIDLLTGAVTYDLHAGEILGLGNDLISNASLLDIIHADDRDTSIETMRRAVEDHLPFDTVFRITRDDATVRWVHGWGQPVDDGLGDIRKVVGVLQDVTEEHEARRLVEERQQRLQLVLDATVTGTFDWDLRRSSIVFSENWIDSIGYGPDELDLDHWNWQRIVHPDDFVEASHLLATHLAGQSPTFGLDVRLRHKDGSWRWARVAARVVERDETGRVRRIIGAETDISGQRTLEQQLAHAATMHSLGEFAGGIAHDFNNVMAIVRGHTEALMQLRLGDDDVDRRLASIDRAVGRASSLVRELMLLARPATDNPVVIDLAAHVNAAAVTWMMFLGVDVVLVLDLDEGTFPVRIDASRLDSALLNIAANARDAMPDGGKLQITLRRCVDTQGRRFAEIAMIDEGIGMDAETLGALFEPFFTTKGPGVGTGLGLATSHTTVTQAGGMISAVSERGVGTTITMALPIADVDVAPDPTPIESARIESSGASILIVEDEAELVELNADVLRLAGHRVHEALDGIEALEIVASGAQIDLLLTDAVMPVMSGRALAAAVREQLPGVRVLFLSGYAPSPDATDEFGASQFLAKPIGADDLVRAVAAALRRDP